MIAVACIVQCALCIVYRILMIWHIPLCLLPLWGQCADNFLKLYAAKALSTLRAFCILVLCLCRKNRLRICLQPLLKLELHTEKTVPSRFLSTAFKNRSFTCTSTFKGILYLSLSDYAVIEKQSPRNGNLISLHVSWHEHSCWPQYCDIATSRKPLS